MIGVSVDPVEQNRAFAEKFDFPFRLLCDTEREVALAYGAAEKADDAHARRITYVIGPEGRIEKAIDTKDPAGQAESLLAEIGGASLEA